MESHFKTSKNKTAMYIVYLYIFHMTLAMLGHNWELYIITKKTYDILWHVPITQKIDESNPSDGEATTSGSSAPNPIDSPPPAPSVPQWFDGANVTPGGWWKRGGKNAGMTFYGDDFHDGTLNGWMGFWMGFEWDFTGFWWDFDGFLGLFMVFHWVLNGMTNGILMGSGKKGTGIDATAIQVGNWAIWAIVRAMDWFVRHPGFNSSQFLTHDPKLDHPCLLHSKMCFFAWLLIAFLLKLQV